MAKAPNFTDKDNFNKIGVTPGYSTPAYKTQVKSSAPKVTDSMASSRHTYPSRHRGHRRK